MAPRVSAITGNPQLALWHSFSNEAPGDPTDWLYQVRQYGMHTYLFFLTEVAGVPAPVVTDGFYSGTRSSPQQYHYMMVGGEALRGHFADWAAHNTGDLDYLTAAQVARARREVEGVGDPNNLHPFVATYVDSGTEAWFRPPAELTARGWAYNVVRITNSAAATYTFQLSGDPLGSEGAASHFEGRVVVMGAGGARYAALEMADALTGEGRLVVEADEVAVFLVVASVPEHFTGNQTYGYQVQITRE